MGIKVEERRMVLAALAPLWEANKRNSNSDEPCRASIFQSSVSLCALKEWAREKGQAWVFGPWRTG